MSKADGVKDSDIISLRGEGDKGIREMLPKGVIPDLCYYRPDLNKLFLFEYERSSRGMVDHVTAYSRLFKTYFEDTRMEVSVTFMDSPSHRTTHKRDFLNGYFLTSALKESNAKGKLSIHIWEQPLSTLEEVSDVIEIILGTG